MRITKRLIIAAMIRVLPWALASASGLVMAPIALSQSKFATAPKSTTHTGSNPVISAAAIVNRNVQSSSTESYGAKLSEEANNALEARRWPEAAAALEKLVKLAPTNPEVRANLGLAYYFQGRPAEALAAFTKAVSLRPQMPQAKVMIGICEAELGRNADAVAILAPEFEKPADPEIGRLIGLHLQHSYAEMKQPDKAIDTGEELLRRYPNDAEILFQVSRSYADRSYELMTDLMRSAPDSAWMHFANAQVQESLARYDVARREYENVLQRVPNLPGAHYRLGRVILLGTARTPESLEEATRAFQEELAIDPRNPSAEYELGEINREQGNYDSALDYFSRAVTQQPNFAEAHIGLGRTLIKVGKSGEAIPHLKEAARLEPENKVPHALLAKAYKAVGNATASQAETDTYRKLSQDADAPSLIPATGAPTVQQIDP